MAANYWDGLSRTRLSRRRAMALTGATAAAAALLAACGGGGSSSSTSQQATGSGLVTAPNDTSKQAKHGGIMRDRILSDPPTLDPFTANSPWNAVAPHAYSSLVRAQPGYLKPTDNTTIGDLAESFEWAPDGLQVTLKLRQGVKWHNKPPINGRAFDADDVLFAWDRFTKKSSTRAGVANVVDPSAPILGITATDSKTLVLKLKEPLVYALGLIASNSSGGLVMLPKETDTTFNPATDIIGTGPFVMTNYQPSVSFTFKRNPDYWDSTAAYVDEVDLPMVPEYAAGLAQLKAGNIYSFGSYTALIRLQAEDILPMKSEEPRLNIYQSDLDIPGGPGTKVMIFGWLPAGKSPFLDERVRQAVSMSWDRDLYMDTLANIPKFEAQGLSVTRRWNSALLGNSEGWWLDPQSKDFGPNSKYFVHDIAEAKKLLAAAGYPNGIQDVTSSYVTGPELPTAWHAQIIDQMVNDIGITSHVHSLDYAKEYIPTYRDGKGQFEGWSYKSNSGGPPSGGDAIGAMASLYWSKSSNFHGYADAAVDAMFDKARVELDADKRRALAYDIQRYIGQKMYAIMPPGVTSGFTLAWPCLGNFRVFQGGRVNEHLWVDDTKPPFKPA